MHHFLLRYLPVLNVVLFQGDMERSLGWEPIPLCDKQYVAEVPAMQVFVVVFVVVVLF